MYKLHPHNYTFIFGSVYRHRFHEAIQHRYRFHKAIPQRALMRAVGSLCENGNAVVPLRENGDDMVDTPENIVHVYRRWGDKHHTSKSNNFHENSEKALL